MRRYYYKITYVDNEDKMEQSLATYNKLHIIRDYINILTDKNLNISDLKIYKINVNTNKSREITQETNKFLYK